MYGKRLTIEDYNALLNKPRIQEVVSYLKDLPAYSDLLAHVDEKLIHRGQLEEILTGSLANDYKKLHDFVSSEDKKLFKTFMLRTEIEFILVVLRNLKTKTAISYSNYSSFGITEFPEAVKALSKAASIEDFINLLEKTRYAGALKEINIQSLDFSIVENVLTIHFYNLLFKTITKIYNADELKILQNQIGTTIDVKNIIRIIRLKKYFPNVNIKEYMLPFGRRIKEREIKALIEAQDTMEVLKGISDYYYSRLLSIDLELLDDYEDEMIYEADKNIMRMGQPSMAIPLAYLSLKTIEVHNLIHIIEGIRYSIPVEDIKRRLSGVAELEDARKGKVIL
jgi:V/A-type H+-transporting ATPase subunit C